MGFIDPHTKTSNKNSLCKDIVGEIIQNRVETGEPYIMFGDTVQAALPTVQKEGLLSVHHSNLCSEITLRNKRGKNSSMLSIKCKPWKNMMSGRMIKTLFQI